MTVSKVTGQTVSGSDALATTTLDANFPSTPIAGNLVVVFGGSNATGAPIVSVILDRLGANLTLTRVNRGGSSASIGLYWGIVPAGIGSSAVRLTVTAGAGKQLNGFEFQGTSTTAGVDDNTATGAVDGSGNVFEHATGTSGDVTTAYSTSVADAVLIGALRNGAGTSAWGCTLDGTAATEVSAVQRGGCAFRVIAATTTTANAAWNWTTTAVYSIIAAAFEGTGTTVKQLAALGVG